MPEVPALANSNSSTCVISILFLFLHIGKADLILAAKTCKHSFTSVRNCEKPSWYLATSRIPAGPLICILMRSTTYTHIGNMVIKYTRHTARSTIILLEKAWSLLFILVVPIACDLFLISFHIIHALETISIIVGAM